MVSSRSAGAAPNSGQWPGLETRSWGSGVMAGLSQPLNLPEEGGSAHLTSAKALQDSAR